MHLLGRESLPALPISWLRGFRRELDNKDENAPVSFQATGEVVVDDVPDVGFVNTHAECDSSDDLSAVRGRSGYETHSTIP